MITDEKVQQLFKNGQLHIYLKGYWKFESLPPEVPQFYRGVATRFLNEGTQIDCRRHMPLFDCRRHMLVFTTYNIIPEYCFDCYKIAIEPRTVVELFKLMILFEKAQKNYLPNDNTRKCMVETRPDVSGTYKGFIYSRNLEEAKNILNKTRKVISREISTNIPVSLKRGCTEYSFVYPEFVKLDKSGNPVMEYREEWQAQDTLAYANNMGAGYESPPDTYNHFGFNLFDGQAMLTWIKYAATIGDLSYLKITDLPIPIFKDLKRPKFKPVDSVKKKGNSSTSNKKTRLRKRGRKKKH